MSQDRTLTGVGITVRVHTEVTLLPPPRATPVRATVVLPQYGSSSNIGVMVRAVLGSSDSTTDLPSAVAAVPSTPKRRSKRLTRSIVHVEPNIHRPNHTQFTTHFLLIYFSGQSWSS